MLTASSLCRSLATLGFAVLVAGCHGHGHEEGAATGATCPTTQTLSYGNFGNAFVTDYCSRCHSSTLTGAARNGAPTDVDLDTATAVRTHRHHIDEHAAAGPNATNRAMPPSNPRPTDAERAKLGEWLACGAPESL